MRVIVCVCVCVCVCVRVCVCVSVLVCRQLCVGCVCVLRWPADGLIKLVHSYGVNVRKLGVVRSHVQSSPALCTLILSEMVARVVKIQIKACMRLPHGACTRECVSVRVSMCVRV